MDSYHSSFSYLKASECFAQPLFWPTIFTFLFLFFFFNVWFYRAYCKQLYLTWAACLVSSTILCTVFHICCFIVSFIVSGDYSTGEDNTAMQLVRPVASYIAPLLINMLNVFYLMNTSISRLTVKEQKKLYVNLGVSQGSILEPVLFNLYVLDMKKNIVRLSSRLQYWDDSTLCKNFQPKDINTCFPDIHNGQNETVK